MGEGGGFNETMGGNSTQRSGRSSLNASAPGGGGGRPTSAPTQAQRASGNAVRQRVAEKKKLVEAQFLGREANVVAKDLPPFWSTQMHGVPYNEGDPLDNARATSAGRGKGAAVQRSQHLSPQNSAADFPIEAGTHFTHSLILTKGPHFSSPPKCPPSVLRALGPWRRRREP